MVSVIIAVHVFFFFKTINVKFDPLIITGLQPSNAPTCVTGTQCLGTETKEEENASL